MPVYVDKMFKTRRSQRWPYPSACHIWADSIEELIDFIRSIPGLDERWIHGRKPHMNLTASYRKEAVKRGALEVRGPGAENDHLERIDVTIDGQTFHLALPGDGRFRVFHGRDARRDSFTALIYQAVDGVEHQISLSLKLQKKFPWLPDACDHATMWHREQKEQYAGIPWSTDPDANHKCWQHEEQQDKWRAAKAAHVALTAREGEADDGAE